MIFQLVIQALLFLQSRKKRWRHVLSPWIRQEQEPGKHRNSLCSALKICLSVISSFWPLSLIHYMIILIVSVCFLQSPNSSDFPVWSAPVDYWWWIKVYIQISNSFLPVFQTENRELLHKKARLEWSKISCDWDWLIVFESLVCRGELFPSWAWVRVWETFVFEKIPQISCISSQELNNVFRAIQKCHFRTKKHWWLNLLICLKISVLRFWRDSHRFYISKLLAVISWQCLTSFLACSM